MSKPIVAIVGRPNVGKSARVNSVIGRNLAVVEDMPGVTRDRNYADAQWEDKRFLLVDTGGFEPETEDPRYIKMREQSRLAVQEARLILFLMDSKEGLPAGEIGVSHELRR